LELPPLPLPPVLSPPLLDPEVVFVEDVSSLHAPITPAANIVVATIHPSFETMTKPYQKESPRNVTERSRLLP
jgi:hypothetical protein